LPPTATLFVATPRAEGIEIDVEFIAGDEELRDFAAGLASRARVVYGRFPAADDDGVRAITFDLPDRDGIFRPHPH
jgi:hypothetical protein